jgi:hypothetical protein
MLALVTFATAGGVAAWKARRKLGLSDVPLSIVLAVVLVNAPFAFALERGNYDLLVVPLALAAVWGLNKRQFAGDVLAGACLALAVGLKAYPGVLVAGLIPLRRWRALALTLAFGATFLAYRFDDLKVAATNLQKLADDHDPETHYKDVIPNPEDRHPLPNTHSITASWYTVWAHTKLSALARIPSAVASGLICCSMLVWIAVLASRCPNPAPALVPLALWRSPWARSCRRCERLQPGVPADGRGRRVGPPRPAGDTRRPRAGRGGVAAGRVPTQPDGGVRGEGGGGDRRRLVPRRPSEGARRTTGPHPGIALMLDVTPLPPPHTDRPGRRHEGDGRRPAVGRAAEKQYLNQVIDSNRLSTGRSPSGSRGLFAELHDCKYSVFCNSGTAPCTSPWRRSRSCTGGRTGRGDRPGGDVRGHQQRGCCTTT